MRRNGIARRMRALGLTVADVARGMNVTTAAVYLWLKGEGPKRGRLVELSKLLRCEPGDLL